MVAEAARALIPGPVASTALATLVVTDPVVLQALSTGELSAGIALEADLREDSGLVSGSADFVLGAHVRGAGDSGVLVLPAGSHVVLVDAGAAGVTVEPLDATDFSRPLAKVVLVRCWPPGNGFPVPLPRPRRHRAGGRGGRRALVGAGHRRRLRQGPRAVRQADRQLQGRQTHVAPRCCCAQQIAVAAADAAAAAEADDDQLSIAAAVAAAVGIDAARGSAKDCIQVLGGIGITWEHDAHLYLRRALGDRAVARRPFALARAGRGS